MKTVNEKETENERKEKKADGSMEKRELEKKLEEKIEERGELGEEKKKSKEKKKEEKAKEGKEGRKEKKAEKKDEALAKGADLPISTKHSMAICDFIRGKDIEQAAEELQEVVEMRRAIPMKGEIPHRKGMMSGRYPINACKVFIKLLKQLAANSNVNLMENPYIHTAKPDKASSPHRRFGSERFKRTNVLLIAREKGEKKDKSDKEDKTINKKN